MLLVTWTGCVCPTQVSKPGGAAHSPPGCLSVDSPLKQFNCSPYSWMKIAWLLAHSTPAFTGLLMLSFTLSSRSLTRGGLCPTSAQPWILLYVDEKPCLSTSYIHTQPKGKAALPRGDTPSPSSPLWTPILTPHPISPLCLAGCLSLSL